MLRSRSRIPGRLLVAALLSAAGLGCSAQAQAAPRPDLRVSGGSVRAAGTAISGRVTVKNLGAVRAPRTTGLLRYGASTGAGAVTLKAVKVRAIAPRASAVVRIRATVPATVAAGTYPLTFCADGLGKLTERSELNNCTRVGDLVVGQSPQSGGLPSTPTGPDRTPPETTLLTGPPALSGDSMPTFTFSTAESGGYSFRCQIDARPPVVCASPYATPNLADARHTFSVWAVDAAGNADPTPAKLQWKVDTRAPTILLLAPVPNAAAHSLTATFTSEAGVSFSCWVDDQAPEPCTTPWTTGALPPGPHAVRVQATDGAGNTGTTKATGTL